MVKHRGHVEDKRSMSFMNTATANEATFEVLLGVTFKTFANYMNHAAHPPLDEPFQRFRWERPE
jgi:hypothetical protein